MQIKVTPEQIQALGRGEEIVVLVRMEYPPLNAKELDDLRFELKKQDDDGWVKDYDECNRAVYTRCESAFDRVIEIATELLDVTCPVAVGDTVEVEYPAPGMLGMPLHRRTAPAIVRHIAHREMREPPRLELVRDRPGDDLRTEDIAGYGHYWEVRLGNDQ